MVTELLSTKDIEQAKRLILESGLRFESDYDVLIGVFEDKELAAVGARAGNILKMLVVSPPFQGSSVLGTLLTELMRSAGYEGYDVFFIFTRPQHAPSFQSFNFEPLVHHTQTTLLEFGGGLRRYLRGHKSLVQLGDNGALVMNCNPFTLGHRYVIEQAAKRCDILYIFVVREDRSVFPFDVRLRLVRQGVAHLENVRVFDSDLYSVSSLTFPAYFLHQEEQAQQVQMEVDLLIFARHLAPFFHIRKRFFGTEPYCRTTRLYNETMKGLLPEFGITPQEIPRATIDGEAISAFRVREALKREAYESLRWLVPKSTYDFLMSDEARELREKLMTYQRRH